MYLRYKERGIIVTVASICILVMNSPMEDSFFTFLGKTYRILALNTQLKGYYTFICNVIDVVAL